MDINALYNFVMKAITLFCYGVAEKKIFKGTLTVNSNAGQNCGSESRESAKITKKVAPSIIPCEQLCIKFIPYFSCFNQHT